MKYKIHDKRSFSLFRESGFNQLNNFTKGKINAGRYSTGFTLLELIIGIGILVIILAISIPSIISLQRRPLVNNTSEEVMNTLKLAQNKALSSEGNSQYGVYFNTTADPHQYILFKGSSYALRDTAFDQIYSISSETEFYAINIGGGNEIVFDRLTGTTQNPGDISLRLKMDNSQTKTINVDGFGVIGFNTPSAPSDSARAKDSRHVNFNYNRVIDTATENIILTFDGSTIVTIPINEHYDGNQFYWKGNVSVNGTNQTVIIHTLRFNAPDTRFSIFRDRRYNNESLTMGISADATGNLAEYSADGLTTAYHSIYVNNFEWQ